MTTPGPSRTAPPLLGEAKPRERHPTRAPLLTSESETQLFRIRPLKREPAGCACGQLQVVLSSSQRSPLHDASYSRNAEAAGAWSLLVYTERRDSMYWVRGIGLPDWTKKSFDDLRDVSPEEAASGGQDRLQIANERGPELEGKVRVVVVIDRLHDLLDVPCGGHSPASSRRTSFERTAGPVERDHAAALVAEALVPDPAAAPVETLVGELDQLGRVGALGGPQGSTVSKVSRDAPDRSSTAQSICWHRFIPSG